MAGVPLFVSRTLAQRGSVTFQAAQRVSCRGIIGVLTLQAAASDWEQSREDFLEVVSILQVKEAEQASGTGHLRWNPDLSGPHVAHL